MSEAPTEKRPSRSLALLFLGASIVVPMVLLVECGHTDGTLTVSGSPHGDFVIEPSDCHALLPYGSYGAALRGASPDSGAAYLVADPASRGREVQIEVPGSCDDEDPDDCEVFLVSEAACTTFEVQVENTQTTVSDVRLVKGHAALECILDDGTTVSGRVDFDGC